MNDRLLVIDTATPACSVALFSGGELVANSYQEIGRGHAERLIPLIAAFPEKGRANNILVNCGPGSFTGVRIGISAAKALAMAWNANLLGYQCLSLVAAQTLAALAEKEPVFAVMKGGHGELFVQNFGADGAASDELESLSPETAVSKCKAKIISGSGAAELGAAKGLLYPDARHAILLNESNMLQHVSPIYGREPDAKPNVTKTRNDA